MTSTVEPSGIHIPASSSTVRVKLLEGVRRLVDPAQFYWSSPAGVTTNENMDAPVWCFLVEHASSGRRVMFDLGARMDLDGQPQAVKNDVEMGMIMDVEKDVATQLKEGGVELESVEAVIWSHGHFDHHGDIHTFPKSTKLVIGPGTQAHFRPGYPLDEDSAILEDYFKDREVREIVYDGPVIGGYSSHDYFGDGSFFLVDAPGHCPGHLVGLARTTSAPDTFILLGGDSAHHPALFRPSVHKPLPPMQQELLPPSLKTIGGPAYAEPFLQVVPKGKPGPHDRDAAAAFIETLKAFDARDDVWVIVAHDGSIVLDSSIEAKQGILPFFPEEITRWKEKHLKEKTFWAFLSSGNPGYLW